ncbi:MAG TPA: SDR family oxidoreductase [Gemmatimonadaceae bacterium]|jgi:NAD(P)-dependent dehydrogenase (short-subunit alcohol dehydrogenase family)
MLTDRVVFITGVGSGIGRALSLGAAARRARVWVTDIDGAAAEVVAEACRAAGGRAQARTLDVTDASAVERAIAEMVAAEGRLDVCFNNAGIGFAGEFRDSTIEHWHRVLDVNLFGVINVAHAAYRQMVAQRSGHLVNTASLAGLIPTPGLSAYGAGKWAVVSLTHALRLEGRGLGVRVSAICPGFIESNIYSRTLVAGLKADAMRTMAPFPIVPVEGLVERVFAGLARNEALIVYPGYARLLWWLWRLVPWATTWKGLAQVEKIRAEFRIVR